MAPYDHSGPNKKKNREEWEDLIDWEEVLGEEEDDGWDWKGSNDSDCDNYDDY